MSTKFAKLTKYLLMLLVILMILVGCGSVNDVDDSVYEEEIIEIDTNESVDKNVGTQSEDPNNNSNNKIKENPANISNLGKPDTGNYKLIKVDGGDTNGHRQSNVVVNIGHGAREYWAYTNEHGQLIRVTAKEIIIQNDATEDINSDGRYYSKMADVPGVGAKYGYDRGHVIADSLGGVANAYNITPQEATLNRHGDQAYMENNIRKAGGAINFEAIITYPDTNTQIPSHYQFTYTIKGNTITDKFENKSPDKVNSELGLTGPTQSEPSEPTNANNSDYNAQNPGNVKEGDIKAVDVNGNGTVTIQEAKDAGFSMPIYEGHWLYEHMRDNNNNGMVGE